MWPTRCGPGAWPWPSAAGSCCASRTTTVNGHGRIKLGGETWSARLAEGTTTAVGPGEEVRVIALHGATAIVAPVAPVDDPSPEPPPAPLA